MIEKIKAFYRKAKTLAQEIREQHRSEICLGAGLALFGAGWHPLVGFLGGAITAILLVATVNRDNETAGAINLPSDLAIVVGALLGALAAALLRFAFGGA